MDNSNRPSIRAYIGATGSGKGVSVREYLTKNRPRRLLVWDPLGEYGDFVTATTGDLAEVARRLDAAGPRGAFAVAFWPGADPTKYGDLFELWCRIAFAAGNCVALVEELADVTTPSRAPLGWRRLTTQGRHRGLQVIACSQRPAQVDKQFLGGCTYIRCFTLRYPMDRQAMSGAMDVPLTAIAELQTVEGPRGVVINYLERDFRTQKTTKGEIQMPRKKG
jgi:hypothetical protein